VIDIPKVKMYKLVMARTSYVQITSEMEKPFKSCLQSGDRYTFLRIIRKHKYFGRARISFLKRTEMISECARIWNEFDQPTRDSWIAAAAVNSQRGYTLFCQDQIFRIKYGIPGEATPSLLHQYKVGRIVIEAPSKAIRLAQFHPSSYYVQRKIQGTKSQYQPVKIEELFSLPLTISINYKSILESAGEFPSAIFYAEVYHNYQGRTLTTVFECELSLVSDWVNVSANLSSVLGLAIGYNLYIDINDCIGELQFDDIRATHNITNWVRDFRCNAIDQQFTRAFYQVPAHWTPEIISDDCFFDSVYPT
jgi:hypothetical protein